LRALPPNLVALMADSARQKLQLQGRALLITKTVNQQKLYASRFAKIWDAGVCIDLFCSLDSRIVMHFT